jgi:hypothetical protein
MATLWMLSGRDIRFLPKVSGLTGRLVPVLCAVDWAFRLYPNCAERFFFRAYY